MSLRPTPTATATPDPAAAAVTTRPAAPPPAGIRLAITTGAALYGGALSALFLRAPHKTPDFLAWWFAARALLAGQNPYALVAVDGVRRLPEPFFYPLPTALLSIPLAPLPLWLAGTLFFALSSALLAWGATRDGYHRLLLFASAPFLLAAQLAQWSPLVMASALLPALGWLAVMKPSIGVAAFAWRPTRVAVLGGAALLLASLLVLPSWPHDWLANLHHLRGHPAPVTVGAGALCALALLRWRTADARLLLAMACLPQILLFHDQLLLWLIPRSLRESAFLTAASVVGFFLWIGDLGPGVHPLLSAQPYVIACVYLPALLLVLRRPNVASDDDADLGQWMPRRLLGWLRGAGRPA